MIRTTTTMTARTQPANPSLILCLPSAPRTAARVRDHAVGVGLRLVLGAFGADARGLHLAERVDGLRRRIDLLHLDLGNLNTGLIIIEGLLHQIGDRRLDARLAAGEDRLKL